MGVLQLIDITHHYEQGEVWYEWVERVEPSERRATLIPPEDELEALRQSSPDRRHQLKAW